MKNNKKQMKRNSKRKKKELLLRKQTRNTQERNKSMNRLGNTDRELIDDLVNDCVEVKKHELRSYSNRIISKKRESESSIRSYQIRPSDNPRHQTYE